MRSTIPDVSVIILSYNVKELLGKCLNTLIKESKRVNCEVIVVENGSKDGSGDFVESNFPTVRLIRSQINTGFSGGNNIGFRNAKGRYFVLLNADAFIHPGTLDKAIEKMDKDPRIGLGGARLIGPDGAWQPSARLFPSFLNNFLHLSGLAAKYPHSKFFGRPDRTWASPDKSAMVDWVPAAFSIIRPEVLEKVGNIGITLVKSLLIFYGTPSLFF